MQDNNEQQAEQKHQFGAPLHETMAAPDLMTAFARRDGFARVVREGGEKYGGSDDKSSRLFVAANAINKVLEDVHGFEVAVDVRRNNSTAPGDAFIIGNVMLVHYHKDPGYVHYYNLIITDHANAAADEDTLLAAFSKSPGDQAIEVATSKLSHNLGVNEAFQRVRVCGQSLIVAPHFKFDDPMLMHNLVAHAIDELVAVRAPDCSMPAFDDVFNRVDPHDHHRLGMSVEINLNKNRNTRDLFGYPVRSDVEIKVKMAERAGREVTVNSHDLFSFTGYIDYVPVATGGRKHAWSPVDIQLKAAFVMTGVTALVDSLANERAIVLAIGAASRFMESGQWLNLYAGDGHAAKQLLKKVFNYEDASLSSGPLSFEDMNYFIKLMSDLVQPGCHVILEMPMNPTSLNAFSYSPQQENFISKALGLALKSLVTEGFSMENFLRRWDKDAPNLYIESGTVIEIGSVAVDGNAIDTRFIDQVSVQDGKSEALRSSYYKVNAPRDVGYTAGRPSARHDEGRRLRHSLLIEEIDKARAESLITHNTAVRLFVISGFVELIDGVMNNNRFNITFDPISSPPPHLSASI